MKNNVNVDTLYKAILKLKTVEECHNFFDDLCTIMEIESMSQRLLVAKLLSKNEVYSEIAKKTGASTATISRVARCLNHGAEGYTMILERLKEDE
ncbi:MAG: hypothetical protein J6V58_06305 [Clostridia bacterium]|nr:hypothetical protein [Clostridia bacterium]